MDVHTGREDCFHEKIAVRVYGTARAASTAVARELAELITRRAAQGKQAVLGLATGSTPTTVYQELIRLHREEGLSFQNVVTFNLDEYFPMDPTSFQSYHRFMKEMLFDHVDIPVENIHIPDGTLQLDQVEDHCCDYERRIKEAGGIDVQILGIGHTGHIGFNEPGSSPTSQTRLVTLTKITRVDAASSFFGEDHVPRRAITMGVGTILHAQKVFLLAWGEDKARVVQMAVEGPVTMQVPASFLQQHHNVQVILDSPSAARLTRFESPWLVGPCPWGTDEAGVRLVKKAVVWLCLKTGKAILKLTDEDYFEHGMADLITQQGPAYKINLDVFNKIQSTITGWPGGKPHCDDSRRPERAQPFPKRVLIFSPHPDDDVISMGGTLMRLVDQGHDVHVAYQTTGSIAVYDDDAIRFVDFAQELSQLCGEKEEEVRRVQSMYADIRSFLANKHPGEVDTPQILNIKGLIRKGEARAACRATGVKDQNVHFLNMPFYDTGRVKKKPLANEDIELVMALMRDVRPHQIYAAGDLSDPHGTHRVCLDAIVQALRRCEKDDWRSSCYIWLYRGAWEEWGVEEQDMVVPLSPEELTRKRHAIFKHQSQKDRPLFPGHDDREFWQRSEARNRATAKLIDQLGLAEYEAVEAFVRFREGLLG